METKEGLYQLSGGDVRLWVEQSSSIMVKVISSFGDPVELNAEEARELGKLLLKLVKEIE